MNGERGYEKQLEIESQLQEALESIKQKVEDETITEWTSYTRTTSHDAVDS